MYRRPRNYGLGIRMSFLGCCFVLMIFSLTAISTSLLAPPASVRYESRNQPLELSPGPSGGIIVLSAPLTADFSTYSFDASGVPVLLGHSTATTVASFTWTNATSIWGADACAYAATVIAEPPTVISGTTLPNLTNLTGVASNVVQGVLSIGTGAADAALTSFVNLVHKPDASLGLVRLDSVKSPTQIFAANFVLRYLLALHLPSPSGTFQTRVGSAPTGPWTCPIFGKQECDVCVLSFHQRNPLGGYSLSL